MANKAEKVIVATLVKVHEDLVRRLESSNGREGFEKHTKVEAAKARRDARIAFDTDNL